MCGFFLGGGGVIFLNCYFCFHYYLLSCACLVCFTG